MGGLAGPQAQLTHLSLAWHNLCVSHTVFRWSGSKEMNGGVFVPTETWEDAAWGKCGTEWCHFLQNLKRKHTPEIVNPVFDPVMVILQSLWVEGAKPEALLLKNHLLRTSDRSVREDSGEIGKKSILFRKFICLRFPDHCTEVLLTERTFYAALHRLRMNKQPLKMASVWDTCMWGAPWRRRES